MALFAKRGILNTTVEDITEAADVGKGTFFNYFPSKEHVLGVLLEGQLAKVAEAQAAAESGKHAIREVLRRFMGRIVEEPARSQTTRPRAARHGVFELRGSRHVRGEFGRGSQNFCGSAAARARARRNSRLTSTPST